MALHPELPRSPYADLDPAHRWFPADETLRATAYEQLLPPLVARIRTEVRAWRDGGYAGASDTSRTLLRWWFDTDHVVQVADGSVESFRWYFAQREAMESVIWLYDVKHARDKYDLMRFDALGRRLGRHVPRRLAALRGEDGHRRRQDQGAVAAHRLELLSPPVRARLGALAQLSDEAPNIIVLDRLRADFDGLRIFFKDPVLPDNGMAGRNWREDFQLTLHLQDDVRVVRDVGNLFLTNIHRVYVGDVREPTLEDDDLRDYFLRPFGDRPSGKTTDSKTDLGELIREIDELAVTRLREDRRRPVELHARLHRQGRRRQHCHRRNERPRRTRPAAQDSAPRAVVH
jgi:type III restriction enzyme